MKSYVVAHVSENFYCWVYECTIKRPDINVEDMKQYAKARQCELYEIDFDWRDCYRKFGLFLREFIQDYEYCNRNALHIRKL